MHRKSLHNVGKIILHTCFHGQHRVLVAEHIRQIHLKGLEMGRFGDFVVRPLIKKLICNLAIFEPINLQSLFVRIDQPVLLNTANAVQLHFLLSGWTTQMLSAAFCSVTSKGDVIGVQDVPIFRYYFGFRLTARARSFPRFS